GNGGDGRRPPPRRGPAFADERDKMNGTTRPAQPRGDEMVMGPGPDSQSVSASPLADHGGAGADSHSEDALWIARRVRTRTRLDMALAALVMALACVLGCVPIRNSDVWVHMAAGRQLAGQPRGDADP